MSSDASSDGVRKSTQARQRKVSYVFLTDPNFKASITLRNHNEMGLGQIGITHPRSWVVSSWLAICQILMHVDVPRIVKIMLN